MDESLAQSYEEEVQELMADESLRELLASEDLKDTSKNLEKSIRDEIERRRQEKCPRKCKYSSYCQIKESRLLILLLKLPARALEQQRSKTLRTALANVMAFRCLAEKTFDGKAKEKKLWLMAKRYGEGLEQTIQERIESEKSPPEVIKRNTEILCPLNPQEAEVDTRAKIKSVQGNT